jgi:nucleotide-binding universal stress UspA family protein
MVYAVEPMAGAGAMQFSPQELAADAQACLDAVVDAADTDGVDVTRSVVEGAPGRALVDRSAGATMIVVGRHGHHPILAKLLGSVAEYVVHHAACPVVVVPG